MWRIVLSGCYPLELSSIRETLDYCILGYVRAYCIHGWLTSPLFVLAVMAAQSIPAALLGGREGLHLCQAWHATSGYQYRTAIMVYFWTKGTS